MGWTFFSICRFIIDVNLTSLGFLFKISNPDFVRGARRKMIAGEIESDFMN